MCDGYRGARRLEALREAGVVEVEAEPFESGVDVVGVDLEGGQGVLVGEAQAEELEDVLLEVLPERGVNGRLDLDIARLLRVE